jgi:hypothetical protein
MFKGTNCFINKVRGQALLITIMLVSVALTVVLAMSYTARTDLQLSKLEEENQKALAAAEAGIEALANVPQPQAGTVTRLNINTAIENDELKKLIVEAKKENVAGREFASPLVQQSSQYTLYLSNYPGFSSPYSGTIKIYYSQEYVAAPCDDNAIEIKIIYGCYGPLFENCKIKSFISDKNKLLGGDETDNIYNAQKDMEIAQETFKCETKEIVFSQDPAKYDNAKIMVVRPIFKSTKIGFVGNPILPSQGSVIESTAETPSGVSKKIQLFQSHPQIPAEFFITSF